jgi:transcription antitermination factor NusG
MPSSSCRAASATSEGARRLPVYDHGGLRRQQQQTRLRNVARGSYTAIRARERAIEGLRKGRIIKSTNGGEFEIGQQVAVPVGAFDKLAGKIIGVAGKDVEILLEMEILGRSNVTVEDTTLIAAGFSQSANCNPERS